MGFDWIALGVGTVVGLAFGFVLFYNMHPRYHDITTPALTPDTWLDYIYQRIGRGYATNNIAEVEIETPLPTTAEEREQYRRKQLWTMANRLWWPGGERQHLPWPKPPETS